MYKHNLTKADFYVYEASYFQIIKDQKIKIKKYILAESLKKACYNVCPNCKPRRKAYKDRKQHIILTSIDKNNLCNLHPERISMDRLCPPKMTVEGWLELRDRLYNQYINGENRKQNTPPKAQDAPINRKTESYAIDKGFLVEVPIYEDDSDGVDIKNWLAIITPHETIPGYVARDFCSKAKNPYIYSVAKLDIGDAVEFGADIHDFTNNTVSRNRKYYIVENKTLTELVLISYTSAKAAFYAKKQGAK